MEKLQSIRLKNFQQHKDRTIKFDPYITTIIGATDIGKSTIMRGLKWVALNLPTGTDFIRWGAKEALVELTTDDKVVRRRRGTENVYELDGKEYKAFHNGVPPEVEALLNIGEVNFQDQHDRPFWFCETAGEVSRQLNRIINLTKIDSTLSALVKVLVKARAEVTVSEERLVKATETRSGLTFARKLDQQLKKLEEALVSLDNLRHKSSQLRSLCEQIVRHQEEYEYATAAVTASNKVIEKGETWYRIRIKRRTLESQIKLVERLKAAAVKPLLNMDHLTFLYERWATMQKSNKRTWEIIQKVGTAEEKACQKKAEAAEAKAKIDKAIQNGCPLCGNTIQS